MNLGDDVHIYRWPPVPRGFRWQGLCGTVLKIEAGGRDISVRMHNNGEIISFRPDELHAQWPPVGLDLSRRFQPPTTTPEQVPASPSSDQVQAAWMPRGAVRGWTGLTDGYSFCYHCGEYFTGGMIHCVMCHRTFGSEAALNRHKRGDQCLEPATVRNRNMVYQFGEPRENAHGTLVWRLTSRTDPPWKET